jgi:hypothetical protein
MFMMLERAARCVGVLGIFAALAACDRQTVDATARPYEIVTQMRPESLEAYMQTPRRAYDVCARVRAMQHLPPPPPLVPLPADFAMKRSTYLSSASGYLIRHEEFNVVMEDDCKIRIASSMTEAVMRGGQVYGQRREPGGHTEVAEPAPSGWDPAKTATDEASYTEKRTVGGVGMRCLSAPLRGGITLDKCAGSTNAGLLRDGANDPIALHAREMVPVLNLVVLTEPVSVQIGKPVSPERIALSGVK